MLVNNHFGSYVLVWLCCSPDVIIDVIIKKGGHCIGPMKTLISRLQEDTSSDYISDIDMLCLNIQLSFNQIGACYNMLSLNLCIL